MVSKKSNPALAEKKHYQASENYSSNRLDQTDFGKIYYNMPSTAEFPKSIEELSQLLAHYNSKNIPVTLRNTGHSVNGQTLTSGVQINLRNIDQVQFDKKNLTVTVGAGTSWDTIFKAISFPEYCTPMFPDNPGQRIHACGNASVGGVGFSSAKNGGLWNHVTRLTLVTMTGKIIECSREKNPDYFRFALGGFGRIGIIAEMTIKIERSKSHVIGVGLAYHSLKALEKDLKKAIDDPMVEGITVINFVPGKIMDLLHAEFGVIVVFRDMNPEDDIHPFLHHIQKDYKEDLTVSIRMGDDPRSVPGIEFKHAIFPKKNLVYCYPESEKDANLDLSHVWVDPTAPGEKFLKLIRGCSKIIHKHDIGKYLRMENKLDEWDHIPSYLAYFTKKTAIEKTGFFPLSLSEAKAKQFSVGLAIEPAVPSPKIDQAMSMIKEVNDFAYRIGGRNYLFSHHKLTKAQVTKHYGMKTIKKWNAIKKELDPKHLLNNGVIEHIDDM